MTNVTQLPTAVESPALVAAREELGILHDLFSTVTDRAHAINAEREKLKKMLAQIEVLASDDKITKEMGYLDALITDAQARHDALLPPAPTQAAATDAPPVIASKEPEAAVAG